MSHVCLAWSAQAGSGPSGGPLPARSGGRLAMCPPVGCARSTDAKRPLVSLLRRPGPALSPLRRLGSGCLDDIESCAQGILISELQLVMALDPCTVTVSWITGSFLAEVPCQYRPALQMVAELETCSAL